MNSTEYAASVRYIRPSKHGGMGIFHQKWMVIPAVVSWGVGDCIAALIGSVR